MTGDAAWLWWTLGAAALLAVMLLFWIWQKGRPFAAGDVFRASRMSSGNPPQPVGFTCHKRRC